MLAGIALAIVTAILMKTGKLKYAWVTAAPLAWIAMITTTAAYEKILSANPKIGFLAGANDLHAKALAHTLPPDKLAVVDQLIFNQRLDALLAGFFLIVLWAVIVDMLHAGWKVWLGHPSQTSIEAPYQRSQLPESARG
jgi:carbon starvation protein